MKAVVESVAQKLGCSLPQARLAVDAVLLAIYQQATTKLLLRGFGTFERIRGRLTLRGSRGPKS